MRLRELSFQFEESSCETQSRSTDSLSCTLPARSAGEAAWIVNTFGYSVVFDPVYGLAGVTYSSDKTPRVDTIMIAGTAPIPAARPTNIQGKPVDPKLSSIEISWTPGAANDCKFARWLVTVQGTKVKGGAVSLWTTPSGCENMANREVTKCVATGLTSDTEYSLAFQRESLR